MYQEEERSVSRDKLNRSVDSKKLENLYSLHKKKQHKMQELKKEIDKVSLNMINLGDWYNI